MYIKSLSAIFMVLLVDVALGSSEYHETFKEAIRSKDKSALVRQYPQLKFNEGTQLSKCYSDLYNWQVNFIHDPFMWDNLLSLHFITDLGSKDVCQSSDNTTYVHLNANVTHIPVAVFMGICIPSVACTQDDMDIMTQVITDKINDALQFIDDNVPNGLNALGQGIVVANFTRTELKLYDSDYLLEE